MFIATLTISLLIVLFLFNLWNWYLAFKGYTTIEFWGGKNEASNTKLPGKHSFRSENCWDNLEQIFGSSSFLKILKPTFQRMHNDGVQWSKNTGDIEKGNEDDSLRIITQ